MLRSPREKFIPHREAFKKLSQDQSFEEATLTAMLELQAELSSVTNPEFSSDAHAQLRGAQRYLDILCSLRVPVSNSDLLRSRELNPKAGV